MSSKVIIKADQLRKEYYLYPTPASRLKQMIFGAKRNYYQKFVALEGVDFELEKGQVLGVIGRNGAGKSTLLQLLCGTLTASSGTLQVEGRIAALLELGSGFNAEFSGRENIYMSAALMGLSTDEINAKIDDIIDFAGIRPFIDQPVKTYSSGMYVRLAFSVATSVDPDILVIDEALSVGDGDFAKKSFDRIMAMKAQGKTILFCSHALFQVEALCSQVIWLEAGKVMQAGDPSQVISHYSNFLDAFTVAADATDSPETSETLSAAAQQRDISPSEPSISTTKPSKIVNFSFEVMGAVGLTDKVVSQASDIKLSVDFYSASQEKIPQLAFVVRSESGLLVASCGTWNDQCTPVVDKSGHSHVELIFPQVPLLKGRYSIDVILFCENGLFSYDEIKHACSFDVIQSDQEMGVVRLPHTWHHVAQR